MARQSAHPRHVILRSPDLIGTTKHLRSSQGTFIRQLTTGRSRKLQGFFGPQRTGPQNDRELTGEPYLFNLEGFGQNDILACFE